MTTIVLESGEACPVTLFSLEGCSVVSKKKSFDETYISLQIGSGTAKRVTKPLSCFFSKMGVSPKKILKEFRVLPEFDLPEGTAFSADYFEKGAYVDVSGTTIGRGFAGAMKRHHFSGLRATHGVSVSHRSHGSTGHRKDPGKVFKGKKMAGHMGCKKVTIQSLRVMECDVERGLIAVKGCVPGFESGWVTMADAVKKPFLR
jgi:large subunit ribosomal protein L3